MKKNKFKIDKDDFINFLATASPEEVNALIMEKGKPRKLISPIIFFDDKKDNKRNEKAN